MKKTISFVLMIALAFSVTIFFTGCNSGVEELKMYVPGEYIDEEIFEEFEEWYFEETGKRISVVTPTTFDNVEDIMTAIEHDHADFDLLLPSDYAVERLINKGLLRKIDKSIVDVEQLILPQYLDLARISDPNLEYSVPYMYGTFGIMYDYRKTGKHIDSWSAIFTDEYKGKSANKASLREAISSASIWANREELAALEGDPEAFHAKLQSIFEDFSDKSIRQATNVLKEMTEYSATWGGEDLKFNMATGMTKVEVALMWSCDAGYVMNDYEDDSGEEREGNKDLWYVIPKEGGNIYLDNFVISKYAKNPTAANYFLSFICRKDIALSNSEYAGAISPVAEAYNELYEEYVSDETYLDSANERWNEEYLRQWREMYLETMFPSEETLNRCGSMRDYKDRDGDITWKWVCVYVA